MSGEIEASKLFFEDLGLDKDKVQKILSATLGGLDDGELFLEYVQTECLTFDDGRLKTASFDTSQGFGLRGVLGELTAYAHGSEISEAAIKRAAKTIRAVRSGVGGTIGDSPKRTNRIFYAPDNPLGAFEFKDKVRLNSNAPSGDRNQKHQKCE